jgi:hypothetical protein
MTNKEDHAQSTQTKPENQIAGASCYFQFLTLNCLCPAKLFRYLRISFLLTMFYGLCYVAYVTKFLRLLRG